VGIFFRFLRIRSAKKLATDKLTLIWSLKTNFIFFFIGLRELQNQDSYELIVPKYALTSRSVFQLDFDTNL